MNSITAWKSRRAGDNPFAVHRTEAISYRFENGDWDSFVATLESSGNRGALVGRQGSGKTTLMLELNERLLKEGRSTQYWFVPREPEEIRHEWKMKLASAEADAVFLVDGIERMSLLGREHLFWKTKRFGGLVVTVHRPCRLRTLIRCRTSPLLLRQILETLDYEGPEFDAMAVELWRQHQGNIRDALRQLYDDWAVGKIG